MPSKRAAAYPPRPQRNVKKPIWRVTKEKSANPKSANPHDYTAQRKQKQTHTNTRTVLQRKETQTQNKKTIEKTH